MGKRLLRYAGPALGLALFVVALAVLRRELGAYHYREILQSLRTLPALGVGAALALTALNYLVLTGYDALALRYIRRPLGYGRTALASFVGYAFSNNVGLSMLAGSAVRFRLYTSWGLSAVEIAKVVAFYTASLWLGLFAVGGISFLAEPAPLPPALHLGAGTTRPLGALLLALLAAYLLLVALRRQPVRIRGWSFSPPPRGLALAQVAVSSLDWVLAGAVLYALLPGGVSFPRFLAAYLLAQLVGLVSQVPGGLGVFEVVALSLLKGQVPAGEAFAALLAYRAIYYLLPFGLAVLLLGLHEIYERREGVVKAANLFGRWAPGVAPRVLAFSTFAAGAVLLFSGATPALPDRLNWLRETLPLPVMELSHFLGSLAGVALLLLARGLWLRLDAAYILTLGMLAAGALFSLLKGLDYEEALLLSLMALALLPCRSYFHRRSGLMSRPFTPGWTVAVCLVLLATAWLGFFAHKHMEYSHDLWWDFAFRADASRFLRATVGATALALAFAAAHLLRPAPRRCSLPSGADLERAREVVRESADTSAHLALLGDKALLFSATGRSFLMYAPSGRSLVAMGDPQGEASELPELAWQFREMADREGGWSVFYEVSKENLPLYLDMGLALFKIGEEARVDLTRFTLEGNAQKNLRNTRNKAEKEGATFEIVPPEGVLALLPELRRVSDAWLAEKKTREKRFSLGFFHEPYLTACPCALVRVGGEVVAFSNLWPGAGRAELSLDLMRFTPGAPASVMEYLFIQVMTWGRTEGYRWFNLGMAPLAGLESRSLAPRWNRFGAFVFRSAENFYNFRGVRQFKKKFDPVWQPRYVACPSGLALPKVLADVAALVSGGMKGVVAK